MLNKRLSITIFLLFSFSFITKANLVWPALYTETKHNSLPIIIASLLIEWLVIKRLFKVDWKRAAYYDFIANLASGLIGFFLRPLSGLLWEFTLGYLVVKLFDWGTFNPVAWFFVPIIGGAINTIIELLIIKLIWKEKIQKNHFMFFWLTNWFTVGIATILVIIEPPLM